MPTTGDTVLVGVVDGHFNTRHVELVGSVQDTWNLLTQDRDVTTPRAGQDGVPNHGTPVASLVAGRTTGTARDARLFLVRATDSNQAFASTLAEGVEKSIDQGARVVSLSFAVPPAALAGTSSTTAPLADRIQEVTYTPAQGTPVTVGTALVISAGNTAASLSDQRFYYNPTDRDQRRLMERTILAGGSSGTSRAAQSSYPGEREDLQARFLLAPFSSRAADGTTDDGYLTLRGTSGSTPLIAGMLAELMSRWPHLTAPTATRHLLDTADRGSPLFDRNDCGESGTVNCGAYYMGRGLADLDAALRPRGELAVATGLSVEGASVPVRQSWSAWSQAFGGELAGLEEGTRGLVGFDTLGRDYTLHTADSHQPLRTHARRLTDRMEAQLQRGRLEPALHAQVTPRVSMTSRFDPSGELQAGRLHAELDGLAVSAFTARDELEDLPGDFGAQPHGMATLTHTGGDLAYHLQERTGLSADLRMAQGLNLHTRFWSGSADRSAGQALQGRALSTYRSRHHDVGISYAAGDHTLLSLTLGQRRESGGLLGSVGSGAFNMDGGTRLNTARAGVDIQLNDHFGLWGRYERGFVRFPEGGGLLRSLNDVQTQQAGLGLHWRADDAHQGFFSLAQPLRVESGQAAFDIPVGRTLEGSVIRERRQVPLTPTGRQTDIELGYAFSPSPTRRLEFNVLHVLEPDHVRTAPADTAVLTRYGRRF
ncbi:hypothetical protein M911_16335 [Ectothiorhodospira haloalkaliphila]|uniref:Peptidase S8/S53 domain-containing protein n=1 Tax=Ectothiorhodospira haloalkaliphila TaxID=421628 RepID=W8LAH7_9GAMM|nr:hypothetical protein M911_16335 [Ectothiorhodospira haloalkaliphila]